jgi:ParB family transcriptional regulator, chromosome partitioning protein
MMKGCFRINQIKLGKRHRRDLGDVASLAASIADVGLLHPIVLTPKGDLIAGERRLAACAQLGWTEVPVNIVDIDEIVRGVAARFLPLP